MASGTAHWRGATEPLRTRRVQPVLALASRRHHLESIRRRSAASVFLVDPSQEVDKNDRPLLLAYSQWPQDHAFPRGGRAALHDQAGEYRQGRSVPTGLPCDLAQQQDAGDRRSSSGRWWWAAQRVRIGRDPGLPGRQDRQVNTE